MREFKCPTAIIWGYGNTYNLNLNCSLKSTHTLKKPNADINFWEVVNGVPWNCLVDYNVVDLFCGIGEKYDRLYFSE